MPWSVQAAGSHEEIVELLENAEPIVDDGETLPDGQYKLALKMAQTGLLEFIDEEPATYTEVLVTLGGNSTTKNDPASSRLVVTIENRPATDAEAQSVRE